MVITDLSSAPAGSSSSRCVAPAAAQALTRSRSAFNVPLRGATPGWTERPVAESPGSHASSESNAIRTTSERAAPATQTGTSSCLGYQTAQQIARYIKSTPLPFVMIGVLSLRDALAAKELGAAAVVVSSHGGETIDYTTPILELLPAIRNALPDITILVDSGFRRGSDVFKALALGADCAGRGTQLVVACAAAGRDGVRRVMQLLQEELERVMCLTGSATISAIQPSVLHLPR